MLTDNTELAIRTNRMSAILPLINNTVMTH